LGPGPATVEHALPHGPAHLDAAASHLDRLPTGALYPDADSDVDSNADRHAYAHRNADRHRDVDADSVHHTHTNGHQHHAADLDAHPRSDLDADAQPNPHADAHRRAADSDSFAFMDRFDGAPDRDRRSGDRTADGDDRATHADDGSTHGDDRPRLQLERQLGLRKHNIRTDQSGAPGPGVGGLRLAGPTAGGGANSQRRYGLQRFRLPHRL
jgi:hypothetical protein